MKKIFILTFLLTLFTNVFASHFVNNYTRSNGEYVSGHESMDPGESESTGLSYSHDTVVPRCEYY
jgi:hypothetical protein